MPELSIIVPVYKVEKYLPKCIDSILAQTFRDFELILIDDGSPDRCGEICDAYAARDRRIRVIHQENQGVSAARNAGLDAACGTYLGFVDSDDWIEPEMYETMIAEAKEKKVDVVACGITHFSVDGKELFREFETTAVYSEEALFFTLFSMPNPIGGCVFNKLYVAKKLSSIRQKVGVSMAEDRMFLFDCYSVCKTCAKIPQPLYSVVECADSATHRSDICVPREMLAGSYQLLKLAKSHSKALESKAVDKYLDDCLVHIPRFSEIARVSGQRFRFLRAKCKFKMFRTIVYAALKRLLPSAKIHGYLYEMLRIS